MNERSVLDISDSLTDLTLRLPELEWKISGLGSSFSTQSLPRGLFSTHFGLTGALCIEEIKADIQTLASQNSSRSAVFLASRIQQKINVLVALCQAHSKNNKPEERVHFGLNKLSTRQQWIRSLEEDVTTLTLQHQALLRALEQMKCNAHVSALLGVQGELGEVEKRLTLAQEALNRAIS